MHEITLADAIIQQLKQLAGGYPGKRLTGVRLACGQYQQINETALREAFEVLAAYENMAGVDLALTVEPARGLCRHCGHEFPLNESDFLCPECSSSRFDLVDDKPLTIEQIELDDPPNGDSA